MPVQPRCDIKSAKTRLTWAINTSKSSSDTNSSKTLGEALSAVAPNVHGHALINDRSTVQCGDVVVGKLGSQHVQIFTHIAGQKSIVRGIVPQKGVGAVLCEQVKVATVRQFHHHTRHDLLACFFLSLFVGGAGWMEERNSRRDQGSRSLKRNRNEQSFGERTKDAGKSD